MTRVRRLLAVGGILALAVVITCTFVLGDPTRDKKHYHPGDGDPAAARTGLPEELASTKFADQPAGTYAASDGIKYFWTQVQAKGIASERRPRDFLVLVDTSAGQALGTLTIAKNLVTGLAGKIGADDRMAIWTVCNEVNDLTHGFKASDQLGDAMRALRQEYPGGASNLKKALHDAAEKFGNNPRRQSVVLFLGDGRSILDPITVSDRNDLCAELVKKQIGFFPIPLGHRPDPDNLHGLATG
ncbi:MAG TPA: vWA domain-containing protein, partial [Gemmataceae bacterium]|nr:vWA domain-containing protein [Gemmataceae bacterium]